jgi:hypothetical protein
VHCVTPFSDWWAFERGPGESWAAEIATKSGMNSAAPSNLGVAIHNCCRMEDAVDILGQLSNGACFARLHAIRHSHRFGHGTATQVLSGLPVLRGSLTPNISFTTKICGVGNAYERVDQNNYLTRLPTIRPLKIRYKQSSVLALSRHREQFFKGSVLVAINCRFSFGGNVCSFSIASAPHEETLMVATRMRDTAFKRVLRMMPLAPRALGVALYFLIPGSRRRPAAPSFPLPA